MTKRNFLLGKGERLTKDVEVKGGPVIKDNPYTFVEAKGRLAPMISDTVRNIDALPADACPNDEVIVSLTLNPEYIAKSYYPLELLQHVGIDVVGSKPTKVTPEKRSRNRVPEEQVSTELFARGSRHAFRTWNEQLPNWGGGKKSQDTLVYIEEVHAPEPIEKIKGNPLEYSADTPLELVLHTDELEAQTHMLGFFKEFLEHRRYTVDFGRRFFARGLCFLELEAENHWVQEIAKFSMIRALRQMPKLRMLRPTIRSSNIPSVAPALPDTPALDPSIEVAIFDGGISPDHRLTKWVTPYEFNGTKPAATEYLEHGTSVTSAMLFGHIEPSSQLQQPYSNIDHYRVLDDQPGQNSRELYEVLERIDTVLSSKSYDFVNLSLGPRLPIEDDDVHAWTAVLDDRLSRSDTLAAIAVGNDGEGDEQLGLNRVQVPADCVNALAVGACNRPDENWTRAPYSSVGPGRSPGLVKPDLVEFGGSIERPFLTFTNQDNNDLLPTAGTSFAAPSLLRLGTGVRAHFGNNMNNLTIRTLLVHTAEESEQDVAEVGRGRVARNLDDVILCNDDMIRVVYQGEISPAKYIRATIPLPFEELRGMAKVKATICYKCNTDPHHPSNYTRAGLDATFRPHDGKFKNDDQKHPNSKSFFKKVGSGTDEADLRRDALKWENCLHSCISMRASSLSNPCFDIHYNARMEGRNASPSDKLAYAMVITVEAKKVADLYDQVVRDYATIIEPIRPTLEIPIAT
jgi:subtilisin family serine protease